MNHLIEIIFGKTDCLIREVVFTVVIETLYILAVLAVLVIALGILLFLMIEGVTPLWTISGRFTLAPFTKEGI